MESFKAGRTKVLVSTTVIEVGVDVPNATVMVIEQAERFGLAQLHQLRGRVGRGAAQSYCLLVSEKMGDAARERMRTLVESNDGFYIAEMDLKLRGPGGVFWNETVRAAGVSDCQYCSGSRAAGGGAAGSGGVHYQAAGERGTGRGGGLHPDALAAKLWIGDGGLGKFALRPG